MTSALHTPPVPACAWEKGSPLHKSTQQVRTQGPIRHADCRQRKLADFLCTGGIIQGLISVAHQALST
ncbi:hypothetical protein ETE50_09160 [Escherichia coli]|nr:hypothetical protein ETE50_09160 [Escherichia coli]